MTTASQVQQSGGCLAHSGFSAETVQVDHDRGSTKAVPLTVLNER